VISQNITSTISESHQHAGETPDALFRPTEVVAAVDHHERADGGHDEGHHPAERVHAHRHLDAERTDPRVCLERNVSVGDARAESEGMDHPRDRHEGRGIEDTRPE
jgi:hypothetical protein